MASAASAAALYAYADAIRHRRAPGRPYELAVDVHPGQEDFMAVSEALTGAPVVRGNDLEVLFDGDEIFPALLETIRSARRTLCLVNYVYWRSDIAREVADAVCERAKAGVACTLLVDGVGSFTRGDTVIDCMAAGGARVRKFRPVKPGAARLMDYRTHRRSCVADGRVGLTGGVGISDEWTGDGSRPSSFRETHVRVRGPIVRNLFAGFARDWLDATGEVLAGPDYLPRLEPLADGAPMQLVTSAPSVRDTTAESLYHLVLAAARESIDLEPGYLVPGPGLTQALCNAAARGVRVRIALSGPRTNHMFMRYANRASYERLLSGGVEIHEFQPTMLHTKAMVVDGIWSSIGTLNFDNRSFRLQHEATLAVQSERVAGLLTAQFERDLARSERISLAQWRGRGALERALETAVTTVGREL